MSQSLILIDVLSSAFGKKKKEGKKKRNGQGDFFQGQTHLSDCAMQDFCGC
jgi:hypothetical protein